MLFESLLIWIIRLRLGGVLNLYLRRRVEAPLPLFRQTLLEPGPFFGVGPLILQLTAELVSRLRHMLRSHIDGTT